MDAPTLWLVAVNAFAAVLVVLGALALAIRALTAVFPVAPEVRRAVEPATAAGAPAPTPARLDAPTLAAVQVAVQRALPGGRVVRVDEPTGGPE